MQTTQQGLGPGLEIVRPPRGLRKLAAVLSTLFLILPPALLFAPWQQNVPAQGSVTAFDPLDRLQTIPAPVTGRLVEVLVQEGDYVESGQVLARMADQDPQYDERLQQQIGFTRDKVQAAQDMVALYDQQSKLLEAAREQAIESARFGLNVSIEKVTEAKRDLEAAEADLSQKKAHFERQQRLSEREVVSDLDFQLAESGYLSAVAKVEASKAKIEQAKNSEQAKRADLSKVASDQQAKIESINANREDARSKEALYEKELNEATTKYERQKTQVVTAERAGYISRVHAASTADFLSQGEPLIELIPETERLAVELWVRGVDAPLITPGRKVRLQFEGWPAVQAAGWPSVAIGTFGGEVVFVDAHGGKDGRFRVLIAPDPSDEPWPDQRYLRQGVRTNGWLMLDTVSLGYEFWRILNAFPPSLQSQPDLPPGKGIKAKPKSKGKE